MEDTKKTTDKVNSRHKCSSISQDAKYLESHNKESEIHPDDFDALYERGVFLDKLGRYEEAVASYSKALELVPDSPHAWYNRGNALYELELYEEAITSYDKALALDPEDADAWINRGSALYELEKYEEAFTSYDKALALDLDDADAWINRGNALHDLGRYEKAVAFYDKALEFKSDSPHAWYNRGLCFQELGREDMPNHGESIASYVLKRLMWDYQTIHSYDMALKLEPDNPHVWYVRGNALYERERYEEAIASYEKAIEINPNNPLYWRELGSTYLYCKKYSKSGFAFNRLLELNPSDDETAETFKELLKKKWGSKYLIDELMQDSRFECFRLVDNEILKYHMQLISWQKIDPINLFENTNEMQKWEEEMREGVFFVLTMRIKSFLKYELKAEKIINDIVVMDQDNFQFYTIKNKINFPFNSEKLSPKHFNYTSIFIPKISRVYSLLFLLPKEENIQFFISNKGENIRLL